MDEHDETQTTMPQITEPAPPSDEFDSVLHAKDRAAIALFTSIEALANDNDMSASRLDTLTHAFARMNDTLKAEPDAFLSETGVFGTRVLPDHATYPEAMESFFREVRRLCGLSPTTTESLLVTTLGIQETLAAVRQLWQRATDAEEALGGAGATVRELSAKLDRLGALERFYTSVRRVFGMGLDEYGPKDQDDPVFRVVVQALTDANELGRVRFHIDGLDLLRDSKALSVSARVAEVVDMATNGSKALLELRLVREALARSNDLQNDRFAAPATAVDLLVKMAAQKADVADLDATRRERDAWRNMHEQMSFVVREEIAKLGIAPRFWLPPEESAKVAERFADLTDAERARYAGTVAMVRQVVEHHKKTMDEFDALSRGDIRPRQGCEIAERFRRLFDELKESAALVSQKQEALKLIRKELALRGFSDFILTVDGVRALFASIDKSRIDASALKDRLLSAEAELATARATIQQIGSLLRDGIANKPSSGTNEIGAIIGVAMNSAEKFEPVQIAVGQAVFAKS